MNMVKMTMNELSQELTDEELRELEAAEKKEPVFDDDSPMLMRDLRISPATLKKAKQYGKGYTGLLSRLLDAAIDDEDLVRKCI